MILLRLYRHAVQHIIWQANTGGFGFLAAGAERKGQNEKDGE